MMVRSYCEKCTGLPLGEEDRNKDRCNRAQWTNSCFGYLRKRGSSRSGAGLQGLQGLKEIPPGSWLLPLPLYNIAGVHGKGFHHYLRHKSPVVQACRWICYAGCSVLCTRQMRHFWGKSIVVIMLEQKGQGHAMFGLNYSQTQV